jgi:hypothetical protein
MKQFHPNDEVSGSARKNSREVLLSLGDLLLPSNKNHGLTDGQLHSDRPRSDRKVIYDKNRHAPTAQKDTIWMDIVRIGAIYSLFLCYTAFGFTPPKGDLKAGKPITIH